MPEFFCNPQEKLKEISRFSSVVVMRHPRRGFITYVEIVLPGFSTRLASGVLGHHVITPIGVKLRKVELKIRCQPSSTRSRISHGRFPITCHLNLWLLDAASGHRCPCQAGHCLPHQFLTWRLWSTMSGSVANNFKLIKMMVVIVAEVNFTKEKACAFYLFY